MSIADNLKEIEEKITKAAEISHRKLTGNMMK